eukprot:1930923-Rhodomonas_salina.2
MPCDCATADSRRCHCDIMATLRDVATMTRRESPSGPGLRCIRVSARIAVGVWIRHRDDPSDMSSSISGEPECEGSEMCFLTHLSALQMRRTRHWHTQCKSMFRNLGVNERVRCSRLPRHKHQQSSRSLLRLVAAGAWAQPVHNLTPLPAQRCPGTRGESGSVAEKPDPRHPSAPRLEQQFFAGQLSSLTRKNSNNSFAHTRLSAFSVPSQ